MAGILQAIESITARLATLNVANNDNVTGPLNVRVWNNQLKWIEEANIENQPLPAAFLEVPALKFNRLLNAVDEADAIWRVHLIHEYLDAGDETTYEQDLAIFALRDSVVALLSQFVPTGGGILVRVAEEMDYNHTNLYHYIIDFKSAFIDTKGSPYDTGRTDYQFTTGPTTLKNDRTNVTIEQGGGGVTIGPFKVPQR
jgi:hypothetical protein